jgi:hypothetical protein
MIENIIDYLGLQINAKKKNYHPLMATEYHDLRGLDIRWRVPTFLDVQDEEWMFLCAWGQKVRTAVLNKTEVCMLTNNAQYLLKSKLLPLAQYMMMCYSEYWISDKSSYLLFFNFDIDLSPLKKYGFILGTKINLT